MKQEFEVKVNGEEWINAQDEAFKRLNKDAKIDGFRPGKAPRNMYEKKYGKQGIISEAMDELIDKKYREIITSKKVLPIIEPKVELVNIDDNGFEAKLIIITEPKVTLGEYKNLKVKKEKAKVEKEEIEHAISHLVNDYAELVSKDSKVAKKDIAIIDYEGFKDGIPFDGGKADNYSLEIGSNTFIPGFEDGIIGMKKGEEKDLELTFPEDYASEELKGQKVVFKVKVNDIKERVLPELNKEFFEDLAIPGVTNKEELEKQISKEIEERKNAELENKYVDTLVDKAVSNAKMDICDELIDSEAEAMYEDFLDKMKMQGITEEIYLQYTNSKKEDIVAKMKDEAKKRIEARYLLNAIIKEEKIKVTEKDITKDIKEMTEHYNISEEELLKELGGKETIKMNIMFKKAIDVLKNEEKDK